MKANFRSGLAAVVLGVVLTGCASAGDYYGSDSKVLTDTAGMTVYTFDKDVAGNGESACYGGCAKAWPPVPASKISGDSIGTITRKDGAKQATYNGEPLYYYVGDSAAGDTTGDGVKGVWHIVEQAEKSSGGYSYGNSGY